MNKIDELLMYVIVSILFINLVATIAINLDNLNSIIVISVIIVGLLIYNELFNINNDNRHALSILTICTAFLLSLYIVRYFNYESVKVFIFIIFYQIIKNYKKNKFLIITFLELIYLSLIIYQRNDPLIIIKTIISELTLTGLVIIIILLVFYIINQNKKLERIREQLVFNNCEIEKTHNDLLKAYNKLEEYTIIKERSKIGRQMHDSVGHTLTTALVELEVSKMLHEKNDELAKEKMTLAIDQVRKGLKDLRRSVKALKENIDYINEINELINNTIKHTDINIKVYMDDLNGVKNNILGCVYRIIQEGLTNGIKHGKANAFIIRVTTENDILNIYLEDNGKGVTVLKKGFGINTMEERVEELSGKIEFDYSFQAGFAIFATIPLKGEE